ncbi:MAG: hypothetical protein V3V52_09520, partial [Candidatus Adiutricales bacterium]
NRVKPAFSADEKRHPRAYENGPGDFFYLDFDGPGSSSSVRPQGVIGAEISHGTCFVVVLWNKDGKGGDWK